MQLVLIRHGQSANNASYAAAFAGQQPGRAADSGAEEGEEGDRIVEEVVGYPDRVPDPALTDLGTRQARALGEALSAGRLPFAPTHLYASPTIRAVATALPLAEASGLPVMLQPDAYEVGGIQEIDPRTGARSGLPGATFEELRQHGGPVMAPPGLFPAEDRPWPGGFESDVAQALPRARRLLTSLLLAHRREDVVALVSHQFFAQFVLAAALGWDSPPWRRFRVDNTGHLSLRVEAGQAEAEWVNRAEHLDPGQVSN